MKNKNSLNEIKSARITVKEALKDITALLTHPHLGHFSALTFGGSIPKASFFSPAITDPNEGVLMWYCHNNNIIDKFPLLFLAAEPLRLEQVGIDQPLSENLIVPSAIFMYPGVKTELDVLKHLRDFPIESPGPALAGTLGKKHVIDLSEKFKAMQKNPVDGLPFNEKHWAYFQNNDGILTELVNQRGVEHIHYYFGFDNASSGKNSIRIILVGADEFHLNSTDVIVQRSIPPSFMRQAS